MKIFAVVFLLCLVFVDSKKVCSQHNPVSVSVDGKSQNSLQLCGRDIELQYKASIDYISIVTTDGNHKMCNSTKFTNNFVEDPKQEIIITELCDFKVQLVEHVLHLTSHTKDIQCIQNIKVQTCNLEMKTSHITKRWLPRSDVKSSHSKFHLFLIGLMSCTVTIIIITASISLFMSCCSQFRKSNGNSQSKDPETIGLTDSLHSANNNSLELPTNGPRAPPSTPQETVTTTSSPVPPEYLASSLPNIPHITVKSKTNIDGNSYQTDGTVQSSEPLYHVLEKRDTSSNENGSVSLDQTRQMFETNNELRRSSGERVYFVLDVTLDGPQGEKKELDKEEEARDGGHEIDDDPARTQGSNRIYHVLEPLSSEAQLCSVCNKSIKNEPDSMYLVILPDQQEENISQEQQPTAKTDAEERIYHVLEQPSVICQSCLYATEGDPIYNEVENLPDPIYDRIRMFRQETSLSENSHIYMSLEIPDENPPTPRKVLLKELQLNSTSGDYASIPGSPLHSPIKIIEHHHHGNLSSLVSSLKSKLMSQLKHIRHQDTPTNYPEQQTKEIEEVNEDIETTNQEYHTYMNTGQGVDPAITLTQVQMKLDGIQQIEKEDKPFPTDVTSPRGLVRSMSHNNTPLIIAQRQRSGSYHELNIDDIWNYQMENRYAPVSILVRRAPSPTKFRKGTSLRSRRSIFLRNLSNQMSNASDYETPIKLSPHAQISPKAFIPPPQIIRAKLGGLPRQDAMKRTDYSFDSLIPEEPAEKKPILSAISEPCLNLGSLSDDDYDYLERLSITHSPTKQTFEKRYSSRSPSPTKQYLGRAKTVPILKTPSFLLYGRQDVDDYEETDV